MTLKDLLKTYPWARYSKKVLLRIETPYCQGTFELSDADERELFLAHGFQGSLVDGNRFDFYWLVDKQDGVVIDSRFQAFGTTALIGGAEVACELVIGKNYDQAKRVTVDLIDMHVRDKNDTPAFPEETYSHLNLIIDALEDVATKCAHIPLAPSYIAPPVMGHDIEILEGGYPGFEALSKQEKVAVIESVLTQEVRPYIELDAGGVTVLDLLEKQETKEVMIAYSGSCTTCHSATGATLSYIQQILKARVHPNIQVIPVL